MHAYFHLVPTFPPISSSRDYACLMKIAKVCQSAIETVANFLLQVQGLHIHVPEMGYQQSVSVLQAM